nr:hypothetical protein BaRGS_000715 [Batillaria attramentaria]
MLSLEGVQDCPDLSDHSVVACTIAVIRPRPRKRLVTSDEKRLKVPKRNMKTAGERSFSFLAPNVWNSLPVELRDLPTLSQFKSNLKTHLFRQAFHTYD